MHVIGNSHGTRKCIEEVITGLTRNIVRSVIGVVTKSSIFSRNLPFPAFFSEFVCRKDEEQFAVFPQNSE